MSRLFYHDLLGLGAQLRHGHTFLIGDIAKQGAVAAGDRDKTDAPIMFVRSHLCTGEQCHRVDDIVEIVDNDGAVLFEKRVPRGSGTGELTRVGDDISFRSLGAARTEH